MVKIANTEKIKFVSYTCTMYMHCDNTHKNHV